MAIAGALGYLLGLITDKPDRPESLFGTETDRRGVTISYVAPQNFKPLTPTMREKLHKIPGFKDVEEVKIKNFEHAEQLRRHLGDPALPKPIMAGMEPLS